MRVFEVVIALLLGGAALAALARRIGAPYPALVALAGAALALVPGVPTLVLDPELALALFVAPVLLDAAFDASPRDLRANWRPVASLALGAVALTIVVVAVVAQLLVPDMPWAAAIALGAIVAPPDAAAATAVLKQLRPPHRLLVILEGESLFNDASALLVYRLAVGATVDRRSCPAGAWCRRCSCVTVGSVVLGARARARHARAQRAHQRRRDRGRRSSSAGRSRVWILAERLHLSGIITMVVFAMAASRRAPEVIPARIRIPSYAVWEVAVFVLNVLAFILVGLPAQVDRRARVTGATRGALRGGGGGGVRRGDPRAHRVGDGRGGVQPLALPSARGRRRPGRATRSRSRARGAAVVGWCGMRGTVTLAAALALPTAATASPFPYRDLILFTAFGVVLGTLVVQGLTLRPLLLRLALEDDGSVEREVRLARVETLRAALAAAETCPGAETAALVRHRYELQLRRAEEDLADCTRSADGDRQPRQHDVSPRATPTVGDADAAVVQRRDRGPAAALVALRADGTIGDAAFQRRRGGARLGGARLGAVPQGGSAYGRPLTIHHRLLLRL